MLINQAKNLASLPYTSLQQLEQSIQQTQQLLAQAQRIAYDSRSTGLRRRDKWRRSDLEHWKENWVGNLIGGLPGTSAPCRTSRRPPDAMQSRSAFFYAHLSERTTVATERLLGDGE